MDDNEIELLQSKRAKFEDEALSLKESQKCLEKCVRVLEEKIAIADLENSIKDSRECIKQLKSTKSHLERRLREVTQVRKSLTSERLPEVVAKPAQFEITEAYREAEVNCDDSQENVVVVEPIDKESLIECQEAISEYLKKTQTKKRFF
jgi:arsenate reductase-like glutaredoxin family protein